MRPTRDSTVNRSIGARIRVARTRAGLTQERMAERLGVESATVYRFEAGKRGVTLPMLYRIAAVLNVPASSFVESETPAHLIPSYVDGDEVTDLLAPFQRLDPPQKALAIRLVRSIPS